MNRTFFLILALLIMSLFSSSQNANAGYMKGTELMNALEEVMTNKTTYDSVNVVGYIIGVSDTGAEVLFSIPEGATVNQIIHITYNYMKKNPDKWNQPANYCIIEALVETWPLKK